MITFDLAGRDVGARLVRSIRRAAASGPIALRCAEARFVAALELNGAQILDADFSAARFPRGLRLVNVCFRKEANFEGARGSDLWLTDVSFEGDARFRSVRAANLGVKATSFERYSTFDGAILGFGSFRDVTFAADARFRKVKGRGPLTFRSARFAGAASFQGCETRSLNFLGCEFEGPFQSRDLETKDVLSFVGAAFADTRTLEVSAGRELVLRETSFSQPLGLTAASPSVDASRASFERGADILLEPGAVADFRSAAFLGPSLVSTRGTGENGARIVSIDRARVDRLTLQGLDLSKCSLAGLHRLDDVLISGRGQLALAPALVKGSYRREILADEALLRSRRSGRFRWARTPWTTPPSMEDREPLNSQEISDTYRAMRKARESSRDFPGAADFYYGEMEMRREGAGALLERLILNLYWLVSGYGMRAGRAALTYVIAILVLTAGFQTIGLENPPDFWRTLGWTLTASVSLAKPVEDLSLTTAGLYLNLVTRVVGPALIALVVLALRSRVRR